MPVPRPSDDIKTWLADETHRQVLWLSFFSHHIDTHDVTCSQNGTTLHLEQHVIYKKRKKKEKDMYSICSKARREQKTCGGYRK